MQNSFCHRLLLQASIDQVNGFRFYNGKMGLTDMLALEGCQNPSTSSCICGVFGLTSMGQDSGQNPLDLEWPILRFPLELRAGGKPPTWAKRKSFR